ncbi:MAG: Ig-like domain-containing protein, partial [Bacteroidales bacterium]|nr:Ig-like domain-containing protein [Bacteroidales bacterium]
ESISLNKDITSLVVGTSETLVATINPSTATDKTLTWESSDPTVASVNSSGLVSALKAGKTTITVKSTNGKSATCSVTVSAKVIEVESISLDQTKLNLNVDDEQTLVATINPSTATDKTLTWESSDPTVASVDGGKVKALKAGTTTITVKSTNGKSATCFVTVVVPVTSVTMNKKTLEIMAGSSEQLSATVKPDDATETALTWKSSDDTVVAVDNNGKITAKKAGNAVITAETSNGMSDTCTVTVLATGGGGEDLDKTDFTKRK